MSQPPQEEPPPHKPAQSMMPETAPRSPQGSPRLDTKDNSDQELDAQQNHENQQERNQSESTSHHEAAKEPTSPNPGSGMEGSESLGDKEELGEDTKADDTVLDEQPEGDKGLSDEQPALQIQDRPDKADQPDQSTKPSSGTQKQKPQCGHPDRMHYAKKMCHQCYMKKWRRRHKPQQQQQQIVHVPVYMNMFPSQSEMGYARGGIYPYSYPCQTFASLPAPWANGSGGYSAQQVQAMLLQQQAMLTGNTQISTTQPGSKQQPYPQLTPHHLPGQPSMYQSNKKRSRDEYTAQNAWQGAMPMNHDAPYANITAVGGSSAFKDVRSRPEQGYASGFGGPANGLKNLAEMCLSPDRFPTSNDESSRKAQLRSAVDAPAGYPMTYALE